MGCSGSPVGIQKKSVPSTVTVSYFADIPRSRGMTDYLYHGRRVGIDYGDGPHIVGMRYGYRVHCQKLCSGYGHPYPRMQSLLLS